MKLLIAIPIVTLFQIINVNGHPKKVHPECKDDSLKAVLHVKGRTTVVIIIQPDSSMKCDTEVIPQSHKPVAHNHRIPIKAAPHHRGKRKVKQSNGDNGPVPTGVKIHSSTPEGVISFWLRITVLITCMTGVSIFKVHLIIKVGMSGKQPKRKKRP